LQYQIYGLMCFTDLGFPISTCLGILGENIINYYLMWFGFVIRAYPLQPNLLHVSSQPSNSFLLCIVHSNKKDWKLKIKLDHLQYARGSCVVLLYSIILYAISNKTAVMCGAASQYYMIWYWVWLKECANIIQFSMIH
jgi:hypothetical protein